MQAIQHVFGAMADEGVPVQPTAAQRTALQNSQANLNAGYRCLWKDHCRLQRSLERESLEDFVADPKNTSPFEFISALRSNNVLTDAQANAVHNLLQKCMTGSIRGKTPATTPMERKDLYEAFWAAAAKTLETLPLAGNYSARLALGFGLEIRALLVSETNIRPLVQRIDMLEQEVKGLKKMRERSPKRDKPVKPPTQTGKKELICTKWLEGKCSEKCPDGNLHHADIQRITFVCKLKNIKISEEKMLELSKAPKK